ncbi:MAG TPA: PLDc N-terminal domain-containing protein [Actinomycetota bacterium]|nr:PLDc N-terminal domain-containing protein [Actinomycetota bacterium]
MFLAFLLWLGLFLFAILDCLAADPTRCRGFPKLVWIPLIALLPIVGPAAWLMFGRPLQLREQRIANQRPKPSRPLGPDDDPRFLEMTGGPARSAPPRRPSEPDEKPQSGASSEPEASRKPDEDAGPVKGSSPGPQQEGPDATARNAD